MTEFDKMMEVFRKNEIKIAEVAIQQYGSIEKYIESMKNSLNDLPSKIQMGGLNKVKDYSEKVTELMKNIVSDLSKDVSSNEIQSIIGEWINLSNSCVANLDENYWNLMADGYISDNTMIETNDKLYGKGASAFIGKALKVYWGFS